MSIISNVVSPRRTTVVLPEATWRALRLRAFEQGTTVSALIREAAQRLCRERDRAPGSAERSSRSGRRERPATLEELFALPAGALRHRVVGQAGTEPVDYDGADVD